MSLPPPFHTAEEYFMECISFLRRYQHLYNFPNTEIFVNRVLDNINIDNAETLHVFEPDFDLSKHVENTELKYFFNNLQRFKIPHKDIKIEDEKCDVPLNPKKRHEITHLAMEVVQACERSDCKTVVDFGSGLGYLDQRICESSNLNILGIECRESNINSAKTRQIKYFPESLDRVKYMKHFISETSSSHIKEYLSETFIHSGFCITGLHSCADLTVDAINLFLKMDDAKAMVLMPCCYHKMKVEKIQNGAEQRFANFPLSNCLRNLFEDHNGAKYMKIPFLRLATQPPSLTDDLKDLVFNLLSRATLEVYAHKNKCKLKRNKRKPVNMKTKTRDFHSYIKDSVNGFKLIPESETSEKDITFNFEDLISIWRERDNERIFKKAAIFILQQNFLQPIIENFVLYDRIVYLKENGVNNCCFKKIFNETISPRCLCLLAYK